MLAQSCHQEIAHRHECNYKSNLSQAQSHIVDKIVLDLDSNREKVNNRVKALVDELAGSGQTNVFIQQWGLGFGGLGFGSWGFSSESTQMWLPHSARF
jgi:hypothetical protein